VGVGGAGLITRTPYLGYGEKVKEKMSIKIINSRCLDGPPMIPGSKKNQKKTRCSCRII